MQITRNKNKEGRLHTEKSDFDIAYPIRIL